ncbi:hypothetical protein ACLBWX_16585 [Methylobacterium sp. M6A4_1b]
MVGTNGYAETQTFTDGGLTREAVTYAPGGTEISSTKVFNTSGVLTSETRIHADKSADLFLSAITGKTYTAESYSYNAAGVLTEATRTHSDGSYDYHYVLASDGTKTNDQYDAGGTLTSHVVLGPDGYSLAQAFTNGVLTSGVVKFAPGGAEMSNTKAFNPAGVLISETQIHADKSKDVYLSNLMGKTYVAEHDSYDSNGKLEFVDQTNANGSHTQTAYQADQTLMLTAGVVDSFKNFGSNTFVFATGFGNDSITRFHAGSASGHDTLLLDIADVSSFAGVQSHLTSAGADTLLALSATDTILLKNVQLAALTSENFYFQDHGLLHT